MIKFIFLVLSVHLLCDSIQGHDPHDEDEGYSRKVTQYKKLCPRDTSHWTFPDETFHTDDENGQTFSSTRGEAQVSLKGDNGSPVHDDTTSTGEAQVSLKGDNGSPVHDDTTSTGEAQVSLKGDNGSPVHDDTTSTGEAQVSLKGDNGSPVHDDTTSGPLLPSIRSSICPNVPPYLRFVTASEKSEKSWPAEIRQKLRWRIANTKSRVLATTVLSSGLRLIKSDTDWTYLWDKFVKPNRFYETLKQHHKINQVAGIGQFCNKDLLWRNTKRSIALFGRSEFDFVPQTYILPWDRDRLQLAWDEGEKKMWIVKPPRSANGKGVHVITEWDQVPKTDDEEFVVQEYIKPLLVTERKFDLRLYALVTSFRPLRLYFYHDGFVRFATMKYSNVSSDADQIFMHLTNRAVNKKSSSYVKNEDINSFDGSQWSLQALWRYLESQGKETSPIVQKIEDIVIKTLISAEKSVMQFDNLLPNRQTAYQLLGFDIGIDENLKPWLFEVNSSPGMGTDSGLLLSLKDKLVKEYFNIVGYHFPPNLSQKAKEIIMEKLAEQGGVEVERVTFDKRFYTKLRTKEEIKKHEVFTTLKTDREQYLDKILDNLTPDDIRQLITAEDELSQCHAFTRIFPTKNTHSYLKFFEKPRYYNLLLDAWETKYGDDRGAGVERLQNLCRSKIHLDL